MKFFHYQEYIDARYISASEACWRLFGYPMHKEYPSVTRMSVHLPNEQLVIYKDEVEVSQFHTPFLSRILVFFHLYNGYFFIYL